MRRMLGVRIDADPRPRTASPIGFRHQFQDFIEGWNGEAAVEVAVSWTQRRQPLTRTQTPDLRQGEVFGEPTRHGLAIDDLSATPDSEFRMCRHIGGPSDLVLVACNQYAVAGHDQIRLDVVGSLFDRELVAFEGMLWALSACTAVRNNNDVGHGIPQ